jgi:hypothetical protein
VAGHSAKNFQKKKSLSSARWLGTRQRIFLKKNSLPSAKWLDTLPSVRWLDTRQKILCRVLGGWAFDNRVSGGWALGKEFFLKKIFAECQVAGHLAKKFQKKNSLPSAKLEGHSAKI